MVQMFWLIRFQLESWTWGKNWYAGISQIWELKSSETLAVGSPLYCWQNWILFVRLLTAYFWKWAFGGFGGLGFCFDWVAFLFFSDFGVLFLFCLGFFVSGAFLGGCCFFFFWRQKDVWFWSKLSQGFRASS